MPARAYIRSVITLFANLLTTTITMSLLQDVLRSTADAAFIERRLNNISVSQRHSQSSADDSDDELVNVVRNSLPLFRVVS